MSSARSVVTSLAMLCGIATVADAQQTDAQQALSQEFEQRLIEVTEAVRLGDSATLDLMVPADDFRYIEGRRGVVIEMPRRTWVRSGTRLQSYEYEHVRARQLDGTAVVMSIYTEHMDGPYGTARYLVTDVWMQDGPVWALVSRSQAEIGEGQ